MQWYRRPQQRAGEICGLGARLKLCRHLLCLGLAALGTVGPRAADAWVVALEGSVSSDAAGLGIAVDSAGRTVLVGIYQGWIDLGSGRSFAVSGYNGFIGTFAP